jgi:transmembrane sensor
MNLSFNQVEELLGDETFLAWYNKTDAGHITAWDKRIAGDPAQKKLADEAVQILVAIKAKEKPVGDKQLNRAEQRLMNTISTFSTVPSAPVIALKQKRTMWWAAAAIFIVATGLGGWQYFSQHNRSAFQTRYGEIRNELFPDGSQVTLNANTEVTYGKGWQNGKDREVWLKGEAFFEVKKTTEKSRFIVHLANFDVIVTGTKFNVNNRGSKSNVLLKEGSVIIRSPGGKEIFLKPGEFVEYSNGQLQMKTINDILVTSWRDRKFIFEKTPLREVAAALTETYGVKVTLVDDAVAATPISGIFPNDNLDIFLAYLEARDDLEIDKTEKEIVIRKK